MSIFTRFFKKKHAVLDEATLERLRKKEVSGGNVIVKEIVRGDGKERVRIFERSSHTFGVTVQHRSEDADAWFTYPSPNTGAAYDSIETAEREATVSIPWLREKKEPNQAPEPTAPSGRGSP